LVWLRFSFLVDGAITDCNSEIRQKIYRRLFRRVNKILPTTFSGRQDRKWWYQWAEEPRHNFVVPSLPEYAVEKRHIKWNTRATMEEMRLLDSGSFTRMDLTTTVPEGSSFSPQFGRWKLPDVIEKETGRTLSRNISRGPRGVEVHHEILMLCPVLHGVELLGVNKQISAEASDVLYSENTFGFDTGSKIDYIVSRSDRYYPDAVGYLAGGNSNSSLEMYALLNSLLGEGANASAFERRDPLVQFLNKIGVTNALRLRRIMIEGTFELSRMGDFMQSVYLPYNLIEIVPINTAILQQVCRNIRFLQILQKRT
jgi:hypothetical protein